MLNKKEKKLVKMFRDLHWVYWNEIYGRVLRRKKKNWGGEPSIYYYKTVVMIRMFPKLILNGGCFGCHFSSDLKSHVHCNNCFLGLNCAIRKSGWQYLCYSKKTTEVLPHIKAIRDAKIEWENVDMEVIYRMQKLKSKMKQMKII